MYVISTHHVTRLSDGRVRSLSIITTARMMMLYQIDQERRLSILHQSVTALEFFSGLQGWRAGECVATPSTRRCVGQSDNLVSFMRKWIS